MESSLLFFGIFVLLLVQRNTEARYKFKETQKHKDTEYKKALVGLIEFYKQRSVIRQERLKRELQNNEETLKETEEGNPEHDPSEGLYKSRESRSALMGTGHGDDIDQKDVDPNSKLAALLESMLDEHNGKVEKAKGIKPWLKQNAIAENEDHHIYTHHQKVMFGMESENPDSEEDNMPEKLGNTISSPLWEQAIVPYEIDTGSFNPAQITIIETALEEMRTKTCVDWRPRSSELQAQLGHGSYVYIFSDSGCYSYVGRVRTQQFLSLETPWCVTNAITLHEMCHAIGQQHEQSRSDRDSYVRILWDNISQGTDNINMALFSTEDHNPYDAESVLQYGIYAFSINGQKTIEFFDSRLEFLADTAQGLEYYDVQDIIDGYGCADHCVSPPTCLHKGFINHNCTCVCPRGITGETCQTLLTDPGCGGDINLTAGVPVTITTPNYPNNYVSGTTCIWYITSPGDLHIKMTIDDLHLTDGSDSRCYHWLEIQYNLIGQTGFRRCGDITSPESVVSSVDSRNDMLLIFDSAYASDRAADIGFTITVQTTGPGCINRPCLYGTCNAFDDGSYNCTCQEGFSGFLCDTITGDVNLTCSFEFGSPPCFLVDDNADNFDWVINSGETPSIGTGPTNAYSGSSYLYAEMSDPRVQGDITRLISDIGFAASNRCLSFWYNMNGRAVEQLSVSYSSQVQSKTVLWSERGNKFDLWLKQVLDIPAENSVVIYFEAVRGWSWEGDIAIDEVSFTVGTCIIDPCDKFPCLYGGTCTSLGSNYTCTCTSAFTGTNCENLVPGSSLVCDAEDFRTCFMSLDLSYAYTWYRHSRFTSSYDTGPDYAYEGSYYYYFETSYPVVPNDQVVMVTNFTMIPMARCLRFWYHMYGTGMGTIKVLISGTSISDTEVFTRMGNQGYVWSEAEILITATEGLQIKIIGVAGIDYLSDMAIDYITLTEGLCSGAGPCDSNPCSNNGECITLTATDFTCNCNFDYTGPTCDSLIQPCESSPCLNNGTCNNINSTLFNCSCSEGFTGFDCGTIVLPCDSNPCFNNGTCNNLNATAYNCSCDVGYSGSDCGAIVQPCDSNPCLNNGTCINLNATAYNCSCDVGYSGSDCSAIVQPCDSNPCLNNGTCNNLNATAYNCSCDVGYSGSDCGVIVQPCDSNPCLNNGTCNNLNATSYNCSCDVGYSGSDCGAIVQPCDSNPCLNNGTCNSLNATSYNCSCDVGYSGSDCGAIVQPCDSNPCLNNGTCNNLNATAYNCSCDVGYSGSDCGAIVQPCDSNPCLNNGTCNNLNATAYNCSCDVGYSGSDCSVIVQPCDSNPCLNNGTCNSLNATSYNCSCDVGYSGSDCGAIVQPCDSNPCLNNGTCNNLNATAYNCSCDVGYSGSDCGAIVQPCDSNPCLNNGTCNNLNATAYNCSCDVGYSGSDCGAIVQPCDSNPCLNNGTCNNLNATAYNCSCDVGYSGSDCSAIVQPCDSSPCLNNRTCNNLNATAYSCSCAVGYSGSNCSIAVQPCDSNPCLNNGTCNNLNATVYNCSCAVGYAGSDCGLTTASENSYECRFEQGNTSCIFSNDDTDDFDWIVISGPTPSGDGGQVTGPAAAYEGEKYSYTEMTFPRQPGDTSRLVTTANFTESEKCLGLAYHMYGSSVGSISIKTTSTVLWQTSGSKTREWNKIAVDVPAVADLILSIEAVRGDGWSGDIAIDYIWLRNGTCGCDSSPCQNAGTCINDELGSYSCQCQAGYFGDVCGSVNDTVICTFEHGESCFLSGDHSSTFQWIKGTGSTSTSKTGPSAASQGSTYMFIESSSPHRSGDVALLSSHTNFTTDSSTRCLIFDYHMYGDGMGTLNVVTDSVVWSRSGNQGNQWITSGVMIPTTADLQVTFEAIRGSSAKSDIAIDNVVLSPGTCGCLSFPCHNGGTCIPDNETVNGYTCNCPSVFGGVNCDLISASTTLNCTFEKNEDCFLKQSSTNIWDWSLMSGPTPTNATGPPFAVQGSRYAYLESSPPGKYKEHAILDTAHLQFEPAARCLQFYYHMHGADIYELRVYAGQRDGKMRRKARYLSDQGDNWIQARINIASETNLYVYFIARVGTGAQGDIAIDDVHFFPGSSSGVYSKGDPSTTQVELPP